VRAARELKHKAAENDCYGADDEKQNPKENTAARRRKDIVAFKENARTDTNAYNHGDCSEQTISVF
jgi:hypothetical protein